MQEDLCYLLMEEFLVLDHFIQLLTDISETRLGDDFLVSDHFIQLLTDISETPETRLGVLLKTTGRVLWRPRFSYCCWWWVLCRWWLRG